MLKYQCSPALIAHFFRAKLPYIHGQEARSAELREKFETAVPSIQEKLKVEAERRRQQRLDNDELRAKLVSFAEQTRLRCATCGIQDIYIYPPRHEMVGWVGFVVVLDVFYFSVLGTHKIYGGFFFFRVNTFAKYSCSVCVGIRCF